MMDKEQLKIKVKKLFHIAKNDPDQDKRLDARRKLRDINEKHNITNLNYGNAKQN